MQRQARRQQGFTLIELMMTIAITTILLALGLPSMSSLVSASESRAARQELWTALNVARAGAVTSHRRHVICPSTDHDTCSGGLRWDHGWIVFLDNNENGLRDGNDEVVSVGNAVRQGVVISTTVGRDRVGFRTDGSSAGNNATFTICDRRGTSNATSLVVSNPGRIRSGTPTSASAAQTCALLVSGA